MKWLDIDTLHLLQEVQDALLEVEQTGNKELSNAAESVLSALVVVLRRKKAVVPNALAPHVALLVKRKR